MRAQHSDHLSLHWPSFLPEAGRMQITIGPQLKMSEVRQWLLTWSSDYVLGALPPPGCLDGQDLTLLSLELGIELPDLANKNTEYPVKFELQMTSYFLIYPHHSCILYGNPN